MASPETARALTVVAIDGPVGVGKSAVARHVATRLGFLFVDTGAMYRAVALRVMALPEHERTEARLAELVGALDIALGLDGSVTLDGHDVTLDIRDESVSRHVHLAADSRAVREALVAKQRALACSRPSVLEGRDIGTVVCPDARWKIYLDASTDERVERRALQLEALGKPVDRASIRRNLIDRDARDRARPWGALRIADDALVLDTTGMTESRVIELLVAVVEAG